MNKVERGYSQFAGYHGFGTRSIRIDSDMMAGLAAGDSTCRNLIRIIFFDRQTTLASSQALPITAA